MTRPEEHEAVQSFGVWRRLFLGFGLGVSLLMVLRAQFEGDAFRLTIHGWLLAKEGFLVPFGALTAAGGYQPGSLTSLAMGLPLFVWQDYRAIGGFTVVLHLLAYLLLDRSLQPVLSPKGRLALCVLYWLNPWRLFHSAHIWNPNLLFLPASVHLATAAALRERGRFWATLWHVLAIGAAFHLHASFLVLVVASALLLLRRLIRVHWGGVIAGGLLLALSLWDWVQAALEYPQIRPLSEGMLGGGLLQVEPVLEVALYWLRFPSAAYTSRMTTLDFTPVLGEWWDAILAPAFSVLFPLCAAITLLVVVLANVASTKRLLGERSSGLAHWLLGYSGLVFVALMMVIAASPAIDNSVGASGMTSWRGFIALHAAILPVVLYLERSALPSSRWKLPGVALKAYGVILLLLSLAMSVAAPMYRQGGREAIVTEVRVMPDMAAELGVLEHAQIEVHPEGWGGDLLEGPSALERLEANPTHGRFMRGKGAK